MIEKISAELKQNRQPLNVLDPGCGTGTLLIALAGKFPDHNFTGIEWNRITAAIASFRTRKLKTSESCGRTCSTFLLPNLTLLPVF